MKRVLKRFLSLIFLLLLFILKVDAESYQSSFVELNSKQRFMTSKFVIDLEYSENDDILRGYAFNKTDDIYYFHYIIYYYNDSQELIGVNDGYNLIDKSGSSTSSLESGTYLNIFDSSKIYSNYSLNDVKYYSLFIEPASKEVTEKFLNEGVKLNPNGVDKIVDKDTVSMFSSNLNNGNYVDESNVLDKADSLDYTKDYVIEKYDIDIKVNENNTFDVVENITAYFNESKHGIFRTIPLKNEIVRLDGTTSKNVAQVYNLSVNKKYKVSRENNNYKIQIGSADTLVKGKQDYVIKYTYNIGKDPLKDYDELYYNIIGTEWDTDIGGITFKITMPKDFDSSKLGFSSGGKGSIDNSNVTYTINGNEIIGSYNGVLKSRNALTVRCELEEGYFVGAKLRVEPILYFMLLVPVLSVVISLLIWSKKGKNNEVVETVEFYPPEGFNSLELGFLYKGEADSNDVISLLIYLANKGYIEIIENEYKSLFNIVKGFKIKKLKEYDGDNLNEKIFFKGLFSGTYDVDGYTFSRIKNMSLKKKNEVNDSTVDEDSENVVSDLDLEDSFYIVVDQILMNVNTKANKEKVTEKVPFMAKFMIIVMAIVSYCLITIPPIMFYGEAGACIIGLLFPGIAILVIFGTLFSKKNNVNQKNVGAVLISNIFVVIWGLFFGGIPWGVFVLIPLLQNKIFLVVYIIGVICVIILIAIFNNFKKRTEYGTQMLGKIKGFKNFLETVEKDKLESMVMENPTYFYDILPYTYVLGISEKWIEKFESISVSPPNWYNGSSDFSVHSFKSFMDNTMSCANSISYSPSSDSFGGSSGGSSSGGGSSGGGSGGGGGGSW